MRFYKQSRTMRILMSLFWVLLAIFWLDMLRDRHGWGRLQILVWIVLPTVQILSLWTYWEVTSTELRHGSLFGGGRSFPLRDLLYVGTVRRSGWVGRQLKNSTEVQFAGKPTLYVGVKDRERLRSELNRVLSVEA